MHLTRLYRQPLALFTDLYELTMACGYWTLGMHEEEAAFALVFRAHPFHGGYTVACGLATALDYLRDLRFDADALAYLATLTGNDGKPLFTEAFLSALGDWSFHCDVDAVPEGTVVFPHEPLVRVHGPIWQAQIVESALLNLVNFQTLIATKAARVCQAARGEPVIEFGMRRAQGIDGAVSVARAAYCGGCVGTSNVLAGQLFGIPVMGTIAHSWVMAFPDELAAFQGYARALPNNVLLLVDTYDSLEGVRHAAEVGAELRAQGHTLAGIRLDSGDLAYLSVEARKILDDAGFPDAVIVGSNELDEHVIESLKAQGALVNVWGVGTRLATGYDSPALGGVYKLTAVREAGGRWQPRIKLSEQTAKTTIPGLPRVRRYRDASGFVADMLYDETLGVREAGHITDPADPTRRKQIPPDAAYEELLVPVMRDGTPVYASPPLEDIRARAIAQLAALHPGITRLLNPHEYPVGLEQSLYELRERLILAARAQISG